MYLLGVLGFLSVSGVCRYPRYGVGVPERVTRMPRRIPDDISISYIHNVDEGMRNPRNTRNH